MNSKTTLLHLCISISLLFSVLTGFSQTKQVSDDDLRVLKGQAQQMIGFFEFQQNIIGDPDATLREKQIVINESYRKTFADSLVQIEDDLDPARKFAIFKDVQDYLKDIDFFFKKVEFAYDIIEMKHGFNQNDDLYFTVLTKRKITAIDIKNKKIDNYQNRYFELNYDTTMQGLKIVSIYTNSPEDKTNWQFWWANLPIVWKSFFAEKYNFGDSLSTGDIQNLSKLTSIDISGRTEISDLNPLTDIKSLKSLNLHKSGISDLMPLRFLKNLNKLDVSYTKVKSVEALKYSSFIKDLNLSHTAISNILILENLQKLQNLNLENTKVTDLSVLSGLKAINYLNLNKVKANSFESIQSLINLKEIQLDSSNFENTAFLYNHPKLEKISMNYTAIKDFKLLSGVASLNEMHFENTSISSLAGLEKLKGLKKIYCDYSKISRSEALKLNSKRPDIVVVFESQELANWWGTLDVNWKNYFSRLFKISANPKTEELHQVIKQTKIIINNNKNLVNLNPLVIFNDLHTLEISNAKLVDIKGLSELNKLKNISITSAGLKTIDALSKLKNLKYLDISNNPITDLSALENCIALEEIHAKKCNIATLPSFENLKNIRSFYIDGNNIEDTIVQSFYKIHPASLVLYKSSYLQSWWKNLELNWKNFFIRQYNISAQASNEDLHKLIRTEEITVKDINIKTLSPLKEFLHLKSLVLSDLSLGTLISITEFTELESLSIIRLSISDITPVYKLKKLKKLSINETAVHKLEWEELTNLEYLDISENKIHFIGGIKHLTKLQVLNISNTRVVSSKSLTKLEKLVELKAFNTSIPYFMIKSLVKKKPKLKIVWY